MPLLQSLILGTYPFTPQSGAGPADDATLTLAGDLITPTTRALGQAQTFTDFLPVNSGFGIWPAYTNKTIQSVPGANANTNVTVGGDGAAVLSKVVDPLAPVANASGEVWEFDNSAGSTDATADFAGATGATTAHSISISAKVFAGAPTLMLGTAGVGSTPVTITATQWPGEVGTDNRTLSPNIIPAATDLIRVTVPAGAVVRFVAPQLQTGVVATAWRRTNGTSQSTTAGSIQLPVDGLFTPTNAGFFAWLLPGYPVTTLPNTAATVFDWRDDGNNRLTFRYEASNWSTGRRNITSLTQEDVTKMLTRGVPTTVFSGATSAFVRGSVDGGAIEQTANTFIPTLSVTHALIGSGVSGFAPFYGNILGIATFASGALANGDMVALNAMAPPPTWAQVKGALPATAQLTSLWRCMDATFMKAAA